MAVRDVVKQTSVSKLVDTPLQKGGVKTGIKFIGGAW